MAKTTQNKLAVILYGPPGSGKGTQSALLADKLNFLNLDTGSLLRKILSDPRNKKNKEIQKEKKLNDAGILNSPSFVLKILSQKTREAFNRGDSVIYSGSPRTMHEAFGNKKNKGLIDVIEKLYGKKNVRVLYLSIPEKETIKRNSNRTFCSVCKAIFMAKYSRLKDCPFCGGKIKHRTDDNIKIISTRLKEFRERTLPILAELKRRGYRVNKIDGTPPPYKIFEKLLAYFK